MKKANWMTIGLVIWISSFMIAASATDCASETANGSGSGAVATYGTRTTDGTGVAGGYPVIDTSQGLCYNDFGDTIACPPAGQPFSGQDASYQGLQPSYTDNGDGTITDNNTGLMWQKDPSTVKVSWFQAFTDAEAATTGGYTDWRMPTIKELYSLMNFSGYTGFSAESSKPYIDTDYFGFVYGNTAAGDRFIDAQEWSSNQYVSTVFDGNSCVFGLNLADGRIKCYPLYDPPLMTDHRLYTRLVRGVATYGLNRFTDNGDKTISDSATGLMWMKQDSGALSAGPNADGALSWQDALGWCGGLTYAGYSDWRLPNAKELQSIVDYSRSPDTTSSAAISPLFQASRIIDEAGKTDYAFYWTGTTHVEGPLGDKAVYVAFGRALGWMEAPPPGSGIWNLMDVHGAGAQRSDPKLGDPASYPHGHGPQGDVVRVYNFARCVR